MWFSLLKLDLSSISTQIQGDVEGRNINIDAEDKCRKKLINFQNKLYTFTKTDGVYVDKIELSNVPENIACEFVEKIDKMFNSITSLSTPVKEIDEQGKLSDSSEYTLMYFGGKATYERSLMGISDDIVLVIALNTSDGDFGYTTGSTGYFSRIILPAKEHLIIEEVKKLWGSS